jgi:hypothetical protein
VLAAKDEVVSGKKIVWSGPITKQDGSAAAAAGETMSRQTVETMDYLVKGVTGSAK